MCVFSLSYFFLFHTCECVHSRNVIFEFGAIATPHRPTPDPTKLVAPGKRVRLCVCTLCDRRGVTWWLATTVRTHTEARVVRIRVCV